MYNNLNFDPRDSVQDTIEDAKRISPSVLVIARLAGVSPAVFAKGLAEKDANEDYYLSLVVELKKAEREAEKKAKKEAAGK